jgi:hypothetical protein
MLSDGLLNTNLSINGLWWVPGGDKLFGTLKFNNIEGASLSVIGEFPDIPERERFTYPIILGQTEDNEPITLHNCMLSSSYPYLDIMRKSEITVDTIFIGHHFETENKLEFQSFSIVFSNIERILSPVAKHVSFNNRVQIMEVPIEGICLIRIFAKTTIVRQKKSPATSIKVESDIQINSHSEKTFEKYRELYGTILDFFNFCLKNDVDLVSVTGFYKEGVSGLNEFSNLKQVKVLYRYPTIANLNKPINNLNFYIEQKYCLWIPRILSKWFELYSLKKLDEVFNLYMAVMYSGSDWFLEFQFLALAQSIEAYHSSTLGDASVSKMNRIEDAKKIEKIIEEHLPAKKNWIDEMLSNSLNPSLRERLGEIFDIYSDFCFAYLKFNKKEDLLKKLKDSRNYFTHWARHLKKRAAKDDDLYWLMKDVQFVIRLCLLSELGFELSVLKLIFCLDMMVETRRVRETLQNKIENKANDKQ